MSISARIEHVRAQDLLDEPVPTTRAPGPGFSRRRRLTALAVATLGLPLLTLLLIATRDTLSLEGQVLLYLLAVVVVALVGGILVALPSAVVAALLINYYFVAPRHTLSVARADQVVALVVFVAVAAIVSAAVELAARRARAAELAQEQTETLSGLAATDHDDQQSLREVLRKARDTFDMETVSLIVRQGGEWSDVETSGWAPTGKEAPMRFDVPIGRRLRLVGRGPALFAEDQRVLLAFAGAAEAAYENRRLTEQVRQARTVATADRQRTALLGAVGHDLRTPLSSIKASVSTLRQTDVDWSDAERDELLATIEDSADRLEAVVRNLLDASRLQAGALGVQSQPVALDELISAAILAVPDASAHVRVDVPDDLPLLQADPGLLERVLVNLLDNALRHGGDHGPIEITAFAGGETAKIEIADHGPGVSAEQHERLFEPFQRLDDTRTDGVGLGLSVARGFMEAMDGAMAADRTRGGGLTMRLRLPLARVP